MQTLIDPYELSGPLPVASRAPASALAAEPYDGRATLVDLDIEWELGGGLATEPALPERLMTQAERDRASAARGPRIWSSEDER